MSKKSLLIFGLTNASYENKTALTDLLLSSIFGHQTSFNVGREQIKIKGQI